MFGGVSDYHGIFINPSKKTCTHAKMILDEILTGMYINQTTIDTYFKMIMFQAGMELVLIALGYASIFYMYIGIKVWLARIRLITPRYATTLFYYGMVKPFL